MAEGPFSSFQKQIRLLNDSTFLLLWRFQNWIYLFLKTENSLRFAASRPVCVDLDDRKVAKEYSWNVFAVYRYPLILSIENHCSNVQQRVMAKSFRDVFGGKHTFPNNCLLWLYKNYRGFFINCCKKYEHTVECVLTPSLLRSFRFSITFWQKACCIGWPVSRKIEMWICWQFS